MIAISAVSGGSLGSAYFAASSLPSSVGATPYVWRHSLTADIQLRIPQQAKEMRQVALTAMRSPKTLPSQRSELQVVALRLGAIANSATPLNAAITSSRFVDDMSIDFMAPLLWGCVTPLIGRGEALSRFWERHYGWASHSNLAGIVHDNDGGRMPPVLLLNTTRVEDGRRLVIGIPSLPPSLFRDPEYPLTTLSIENPSYEVSLAEAVRLSSNFPWGIPVGRLRVAPQANPDSFHVLDGGVLDNTGLDSLHELFRRLDACSRQVAQGGTGGNVSPIVAQAAALWDELCCRGVIVIEIDSGAKPRGIGETATHYSEIIDPIQALQKAGYERSQLARRQYLDDIDALLTEAARRLSTEGAWCAAPYQSLTYTCNKGGNVMTAWSLGPDDKAWVHARFLVEDSGVRSQISDYATIRMVRSLRRFTDYLPKSA